MGRKTILAAVCWLTLSQALCDKNSNSVADNVSAESAPRLYGNVPVGVYASAAPYAAYSFHLPQFVTAPKTAASQVAAVKQKPVNQNINTYLMDSYGNRYFETPQQLPYKAAFTQQYVSLQPTLPEHLAQPLVAASPNFQFQQSGPQVFFGAPIRVTSLQTPAPTPLNQFPSFGRLVYADKVQSLAPSSISQNHGFKIPTAQQQPSNNKAVFSNTESNKQYVNKKDEPQFQRQQQISQIIVGKPKSENIQVTSPASASESKFQRIHEIPKEVRGHTQFQRLQEQPNTAKEHTSESAQESSKHQAGNLHSLHNNKAQIQSAPTKQTTFTYVNDINGKKSVVKVQSEPIPLLDLTLLEPLNFKNPLVPQVQHFLPRINQATYQKLPQANLDGVKNYQKEFVIQKTMSYDSRKTNEKPQRNANKKKEKKPTHSHKHNKKNDASKKTHHETLDDAPEIVYEINAPGHKETYIEKAISYNKETQPEPVHYSYGSKSEKEPVTYSFSRSSKDPGQAKQVRYYGKSQGPSHLVYNFKPEELHKEEHVHKNVPNSESNSHEDSAQQSEDGGPGYQNNYNDHPKSSEEYDEVPHEEQSHYHGPSQPINDEPQEHRSNVDTSNYNTGSIQHKEHFNVDPIVQEYEEDIRLLANAQIKVDPTQHVPHAESEHHARAPQREQQSEAPHRHHSSPQKQLHQLPPQQSHHHYSSPQSESHNIQLPYNNEELNRQHLPVAQKQPHPSPSPHPHIHFSSPQHESHHAPAAHIHEKSKRIIIHDEAPDERHMHQEQMKEEVFDREENNEEDFEKAYKNAAFGFPAYSKEALEAEEKDIFDPESYGVPPDHIEYNVENTPFQQYQEEGDEFPKEARASYKDSRDKMKEDYYTDYSISKPESLLDRYQNKLGYYKLYKQQKPDYYVADGDDNDKKKQKPKFAQYSVAPTFGFHSQNEQKAKSYYGHHKPKQQLYEYDYSEGTPRDNSAFASRPYQRYKTKTNFVEPQFQYGFEPISIPKLLDSELAAMASVHRPESEKPGMRKKVYKENWYIKKTSTAGGVPAS